MLRTKSIQLKVSKNDGIRVCIMRRPGKFSDSDFDIWMPALSPSHKLLNDYKQELISWSEYEISFETQVLSKQEFLLKTIIQMSFEAPITLLCWETSPNHCHRRLVAEKCKEINSNLHVIIK